MITSGDKKYKWVESRLREWGFWLIHCTTGGLGYPSRSAETRIGEGSKATVPQYPKDNIYAEEINSLVMDMKKVNGAWFEVVKCEYTNIEKIKRWDYLEIPRSSYYGFLKQAKIYLEAKIN